MTEDDVIQQTQHWIASVVIGLNLCPFAQRVFQSGQIRYHVTTTDDQEELLQSLTRELQALAAGTNPGIETTLLIHPNVLNHFLDYVDFLVLADQQIRRLQLQGIIQLASFHPQYQFAEAEPDAVENYTNRSPYPMLHLLREESISKVASDPDKLLEIPKRNRQTMMQLGRERLEAMLRR
jgi:hypothetical protein